MARAVASACGRGRGQRGVRATIPWNLPRASRSDPHPLPMDACMKPTFPESRLRRLAPSALCLALAAASLTACAQAPAPCGGDAEKPRAGAGAQSGSPAGSPEARARVAIRAIAPQLRVDRIGAAPIAGFRQVIVGGQVVYVSDDGKYLLQGTLLDV